MSNVTVSDEQANKSSYPYVADTSKEPLVHRKKNDLYVLPREYWVLLCIFLGIACAVVGMSSTYWYREMSLEGYPTLHEGLWEICLIGNGSSSRDSHCTSFNIVLFPNMAELYPWFIADRFTSVIGLLILIISFIVSILLTFCRQRLAHVQQYHLQSLLAMQHEHVIPILLSLTWLCFMFCIISYFMIRYDYVGDYAHYSWSYALVVAAEFFVTVPLLLYCWCSTHCTERSPLEDDMSVADSVKFKENLNEVIRFVTDGSLIPPVPEKISLTISRRISQIQNMVTPAEKDLSEMNGDLPVDQKQTQDADSQQSKYADDRDLSAVEEHTDLHFRAPESSVISRHRESAAAEENTDLLYQAPAYGAESSVVSERPESAGVEESTELPSQAPE